MPIFGVGMFSMRPPHWSTGSRDLPHWSMRSRDYDDTDTERSHWSNGWTRYFDRDENPLGRCRLTLVGDL